MLALALACGVRESPTSREGDVPFACERSADCPAGSCLSEFGICTRAAGRLESLLFEVTPQTSDPVYGGARFLTFLDVSAAPPAGERVELNVKPRVPVTGQVLAPPEQQACLVPARSTLPVIVTFTPREQLLGWSVPSYEFETSYDSTLDVQEHIFRGSLPPGSYDIYMRPDFAKLGPGCRAIPQVFRNRSVGLMNGVDDRLELQQPPPSSLTLRIAWGDRLEGWRLDMIDPVTGQLLSNQVILRSDDVDPATNEVVTTLAYSRADRVPTGLADELVRLTPPPGVLAGTVLLERSGLEIVTPGEAKIGNVSTFGDAVEFQAWVWKRGEHDAPVPGTVSFSAIDLDDVADGVPAVFEASAMVDPTGQVNADLLPGRYRVRVTPPGFEIENLGLMAGYESTVTVWPDAAPYGQGGHVIDVPAAKALSGRVIADTNDIPLRRIDIRASAADPARNRCPPTDGGAPAPGCERPLGPPVLQRARAEDPFIPRTRNGLSEGDGAFTVDGLDCGRCEPEAPAYFDLTVRPSVSTGLPWYVRMSVDPVRDAAEIAANPLRIPMPVARPMRVTYGTPVADMDAPAGEEPVTRRLSGALVRVLAVLDDQGHLVQHPEALSVCGSETSADGGRCLRSLIQVAEARTDGDGDFLLLLPPDVE